MNINGCELWLLSTPEVNTFCVACRKVVRRIWSLSFNTRCDVMSMMSHCLPVMDEICSRSLEFILNCIKRHSILVCYVIMYGLYYGRARSVYSWAELIVLFASL
jgi:hypothetical protein